MAARFGVIQKVSSAVRCITLQPFDATRTVACRSVSQTTNLKKCFNISSNDDFINKVMNSRVPVIVNFHAEWCDPCHILTPKLQELIEKMENLNLAIVDVESNPELVHTFEVKAVPAVLAFRNGLVIDKFIGLVDADMIENLVSKLTIKEK
jgi:thioredoxin 1